MHQTSENTMPDCISVIAETSILSRDDIVKLSTLETSTLIEEHNRVNRDIEKISKYAKGDSNSHLPVFKRHRLNVRDELSLRAQAGDQRAANHINR